MLSLGGISPTARAAEPAVRKFDIPTGDAAETLKLFSTQSGRQLVFMSDTVRGEMTGAVKGEFTPRTALEKMLAGTRLLAVKNRDTGALAVRRAATELPPKRAVPEKAGNDRRKEEDVYVMSPFEVTASSDAGYMARNTMAGTRLNSPLGDIPSQVSVMTAEFLEDMAITSLDDAFRFSMNVETVENFISLIAGGGSLDNSVFNEGMQSRTRGLAQSSFTQNLVSTNVESDSYNAERFTLASGPNAILFGLGSAAGLVDVSTKRARHTRPMASLSLRTDNEESLRTTIDYNLPIIPKRFSARVVLLKDNQNGFPKGNDKDEKRLFATATFTPFKRTELYVSYEETKTDLQVWRPLVLLDAITPWLNAGKPLFDNSGITPSSPSSVTNNRIAALGLSSVFGRAPSPNNNNNQIFIAAGATDPSILNIPMLWGGTVVTTNTSVLRPSPDNVSGSLLDSSVFPTDVNVGGNGVRSRRESHNFRAVLEQSLPGNIFVQALYGHEVKDTRTATIPFGQMTLGVDANMYLPDGVTPNPNAGRYYFQNTGRSRSALTVIERDDYRLTAAAELDLTKKFGWLGKWLGRHRMAGVLSREDQRRGGQDFSLRAYEISAVDQAKGLTPARPLVMARVYVDDPRSPTNQGRYSTQLNWNVFDNFTLPTGTKIATYGNPLGSNGDGTINRQQLDSRVAAMQSYWWDGRIITTTGWRKDRQRQSGVPNGTTHIWDYFDDPGLDEIDTDLSGSTRSHGVVVRPFKWISVHYNWGSSFALGDNLLDPYNNRQPGSHGETRDRGFSLTPFGDRLYLRVNFYNNTSGPAISGFHSAVSQAVLRAELDVLDLGAPPHPTYNPNAPENVGFNYRVTSNQRSKGTEVELIGNPTQDWRLSISVAKANASESDIGTAWVRFVEERLPVWAQYADGPQNDNPSDTVADRVIPLLRNINLMKASDGKGVDSLRKWRVRVISRYGFSKGILKGAFVGGAYLWSSANVLGYRTNTIPNPYTFPGLGDNFDTADITKPIYGNPQTSFDAFAGYGRKLFKGKINWRVQLNVRNVLGDDDALVRTVYSDGTPRHYVHTPPRLFILTNTFSY